MTDAETEEESTESTTIDHNYYAELWAEGHGDSNADALYQYAICEGGVPRQVDIESFDIASIKVDLCEEPTYEEEAAAADGTGEEADLTNGDA